MNVLSRAGPAELLAFVGFGYLAALCAQLLPPGTRWIALSRRAESRALALRMGLERTYAFDKVRAELWDAVPLVVEVAGVQQTLDFATWLTGDNGRLVIVPALRDGLRRIADQGLQPALLETHEFQLDDAAAAFRMAEDRPTGFVKAVVRI